LMDFALALPIHLPIKCLFCMNQREAECDDSINYADCARTLDLSFKVGIHGLPLMGCGDWNDGMNRVSVIWAKVRASGSPGS